MCVRVCVCVCDSYECMYTSYILIWVYNHTFTYMCHTYIHIHIYHISGITYIVYQCACVCVRMPQCSWNSTFQQSASLVRASPPQACALMLPRTHAVVVEWVGARRQKDYGKCNLQPHPSTPTLPVYQFTSLNTRCECVWVNGGRRVNGEETLKPPCPCCTRCQGPRRCW